MESSMPEFTVANGPDGLKKALGDMLSQANGDSAFRAQEHYIMYQFNQQKSLIKVDLSEQPFQFWYCDLLGRPATSAVKETIASFLWEECGEKERYEQISGSES